MLFMNEHDIHNMVSITRNYKPEFFKYALYLDHFKEIINENSDGWAHWSPPLRAAKKLMELLLQTRSAMRGVHNVEFPTHAQFKKALTPIKSFATRKGLPAPTLQEAG